MTVRTCTTGDVMAMLQTNTSFITEVSKQNKWQLNFFINNEIHGASKKKGPPTRNLIDVFRFVYLLETLHAFSLVNNTQMLKISSNYFS